MLSSLSWNSGIFEARREINKKGIRGKSFITSKGIVRQAKEFNAKQLHRLLINPIYIGKIKHKNNLHEGEHKAIIQQDTWKKVQSKPRENTQRNKQREESISTVKHPLKGFVYSIDEYALIPSFTWNWKKQKLKDGSVKKTRYRYYSYQRNYPDNKA